MKTTCGCCKKELGHLSAKFKVSDGHICKSCFYSSGGGFNIGTVDSVISMSAAEVSAEIEKIKADTAKVSGHMPTAEIKGKIKFFDDLHSIVLVGSSASILIDYADIIDFDLVEDVGGVVTSSKTKGGLGRAVVGGALLGPVGAIVGGSTGKKKTKSKEKVICNAINVNLIIKDTKAPAKHIKFLLSPCDKGGFVYNSAMTDARRCIALLQSATTTPEESAAAPTSDADEIMKFKNLLDAGVLTQEEFDAKKKQLLGV